jgi:hypothetical protein
MRTKFWLEGLNGRDHSVDLGVDGRTVLRWIIEKMVWEGVDWFGMAQDVEWCRAVLITALNLRVP